ncbi:hypothetical protein Nepgr_005787 [Nepenthes gracilis]|uniref:Uncharacterized protein n=1 Tax=Nepenthes gracilis TaxID=150966 RepID=A0AAD3S3Y9_NEPGR|nr:hypothetical protein Nepgr_005787 [Nepenthes gracilis]
MARKKRVAFDESPPDDFDPANPYKDPVAMFEMREHLGSITTRSAATSSSSTSTPLAASAGARMLALSSSMAPRLNRWSRNDSPLWLFKMIEFGAK